MNFKQLLTFETDYGYFQKERAQHRFLYTTIGTKLFEQLYKKTLIMLMEEILHHLGCK